MSWLPRHASTNVQTEHPCDWVAPSGGCPLRTQLPTTLAQYTDLGLVPTRTLVVFARIRLLPSPLGLGDAVVARYGATSSRRPSSSYSAMATSRNHGAQSAPTSRDIFLTFLKISSSPSSCHRRWHWVTPSWPATERRFSQRPSSSYSATATSRYSGTQDAPNPHAYLQNECCHF